MGSARTSLRGIAALLTAFGTVLVLDGPAHARAQADAHLDTSEPYEAEVTVTASRTEESVVDAPASVTVIPRARIEATPARNFADLLRGVPGLNVIQLSSRDVSVTARAPTGAFATSNLLLLDGHPLVAQSSGLPLWDLSTSTFDEIKQVEVVRGPASTVWGSNALTATVNVRTLSPREQIGTRLEFGSGSVGTRLASVRWADAKEKWGWRIGASWEEQEAYDRKDELPDGTPVPPGYGFDSDGTEQPRIDLRFDREPGDHGLAWSYRAGYAKTSGPVYSFTGPFTFDPDTYRAFAQARCEGQRTSLVVSWDRFNGLSKSLLGAGDNGFEHDTFSVDLASSRVIGSRQLLSYGGTATLDLFDLVAAPEEDARRSIGAYVQDEIQLHEKVLLDLGVRVDHFDTFGTAASPRIAFVFKPAKHQSIRLGASRAFRAPTLLESYLDVNTASVVPLPPDNDPFVFPIHAVGNQDLDETQNDGIELAWTADLREKHLVSVALYRTVIDGVIDFYPSELYTPGDPPPAWPLPLPDLSAYGLPKTFTYRNVGRVRSQGLEVGVESRWSDVLTTTFSWTRQDESEIEKNDPVIPMRVNRPPANMLSASLLASHGRFGGMVSLDWVDDAFWSDVLDQRFWGETDAYLLVNASGRVSFNAGRSELKLAVTNLLDDDVQQHAFGDVISRRAVLSFVRRF